MTHANWCVSQMESTLNSVLETASAPEGKESMENLCLNTIKGNNLTQCYIDATVGCQSNIDSQPTETMKNWEKVMQDIYKLCDGTCPQFLERTINITQCTSMIRFDSLYENAFNIFCTSLNESLLCAQSITEECPMFGRLFYDLLPQGVDATANSICTAGCNNFDEAMGVLENCKIHVMNLPEDLEMACQAYNNFKQCLHASSAPVTCPMFEALMEVLYPQHIFGLYEQQCNKTFDTLPEVPVLICQISVHILGEQKLVINMTLLVLLLVSQDDLFTGSREECGETGEARIKHCVRVLALSWPASLNKSPVSTKQCKAYETGLRCLDNAGYHRCPSLRQYFDEATADRRDFMDMMQNKCSNILSDGKQHNTGKQSVGGGASGLHSTTSLFIVVLTVWHWNH
ncbi:hypothetical protein LOTGIDRAFT_171050 [Lottia gigantea]|uniref:Uncharacterized protein n=1 Tax=Lottia gigantea TaxID=225164 RepID=V4BEK2_LOTGI|nr:hypothetical protein LOTGIDRAFT_171050 [Lottia gigantea]ESP04212.1 hypothetical protein LOTGIDRAFT_171050 [Lottia gigantea]